MGVREKIMPLELLASIKGAASSEDVEALFEIIRKAATDAGSPDSATFEAGSPDAVSLDALRSDEVHPATEMEKELIKQNFPESKDGFLVVPRVIEE